MLDRTDPKAIAASMSVRDIVATVKIPASLTSAEETLAELRRAKQKLHDQLREMIALNLKSSSSMSKMRSEFGGIPEPGGEEAP